MHEPREEQECCPTIRVVSCGPSETGCCTIPRRFLTAKERQKALECYRDQLKNELDGVEERIKTLEVE